MQKCNIFKCMLPGTNLLLLDLCQQTLCRILNGLHKHPLVTVTVYCIYTEVIYLEHRQLVTHITDTLHIFICLPSLQ
jgi:hypothetical protein